MGNYRTCLNKSLIRGWLATVAHWAVDSISINRDEKTRQCEVSWRYAGIHFSLGVIPL